MTEFIPGPWFMVGTPGYLMMHQQVNGVDRLVNPITIVSGAHTEEIATVWNYLLPTEANARLIAAAPAMYEAIRYPGEFGVLLNLAADVVFQYGEERHRGLAENLKKKAFLEMAAQKLVEGIK